MHSSQTPASYHYRFQFRPLLCDLINCSLQKIHKIYNILQVFKHDHKNFRNLTLQSWKIQAK